MFWHVGALDRIGGADVPVVRDEDDPACVVLEREREGLDGGRVDVRRYFVQQPVTPCVSMVHTETL